MNCATAETHGWAKAWNAPFLTSTQNCKKPLWGLDVTDQRLIDETMLEVDGTENKGNLGANAILGRQPRRRARCSRLPWANRLYRYVGASTPERCPFP